VKVALITGAARRGGIGRDQRTRRPRWDSWSDDAAYITGEALNVTGGQTMV